MVADHKFKFVDADVRISEEAVKFSISGIQKLNWWTNRHLPERIALEDLEKVMISEEKGLGLGQLKFKTNDEEYEVNFKKGLTSKVSSILGFQGEKGANELKNTLTSDYEVLEAPIQDPKSEMQRAEPPIGKSVTKERIGKFEEILDRGEKVHYVVKEINVLFPTWYAFTDKRMIVKESKLIGTEDTTVPYKNILSIKLSTSLIDRGLNISTKAGNFDIAIAKGKTGKEELRNLVEYVNERTSDDVKDKKEQIGGKESDSSESKDRLEDLKELHAKGIISDEEFEEKKQEILDEL